MQTDDYDDDIADAMTVPDDGGEAFPTSAPTSPHPAAVFGGMSLRDYFAGQALAGLIVGCAGLLGGDFSAYAKGPCNAVLADRAYAAADQMLKKRIAKAEGR